MYNTKNKTQKAYAKNKPNLNLVPKNCVCVFPIEIVGGKTLVSNQGIMPNRKYYDKGSFLYWQEVFDGRSALKIQWEDSITLIKPKRPEGVETGYNYYYAKPSIGKYYYGKPISNGTEQLEISEDASFEDFMSMKASQTVTLRFEYNPTDRNASWYDLQEKFRFTLVDNDIYNLYLIPELCEEKLMYIEGYQEYYDDLTGLSKGCEITFATLGDKIQKSGKAIEQFCSWNAPGEFSVRPKVIRIGGYGTTDWQKQVIFDIEHYLYPKPIKYLQVEQQGPALTSTIYALGRKQEWVEVEDPETGETNYCWKVGPSKILLPCEFRTTQPNPLNRTTTPSKNFFCFPDEQVTMVTDDKCLEWLFNKATQPLEQVKNSGMISIGDNWIRTGTELPTDNKSNQYDATTKIRKDYFDKNWYPLNYAGSHLGPYDTSGSIYATDTISFTTGDNMIDIMCKNAFIYNSQPIIPLSFYSTRPFYLRDIPIIGSIANLFKLGDIKLGSKTTSRKCSNLCFFGDADIMSMCSQLQGQMGTVFKPGSCVFPINFFGTNESKYQKLGVNAANTTFCVQLTDQISIDNTPWDTIYLGQSTYEDHTEANPHYLFPDTQQSLLVNDTLKPITPVAGANEGFIIDAIVVQSIFDGKIRLSCYGPEEEKFIYPEWTATILSNANWQDGNMRDWTNFFYLSNWEERYCVQEDKFNWPLGPHKKQGGEYKWVINGTDDFQYEYNVNNNNTWQEADLPNYPWSKTQIQDDYILIATYRKGYANLNKLLYSNSISYTDLGVGSITDKDSFINYYSNAVINADDSFVSLTRANTGTVVGSALNIDFIAGQYIYDKTFELAGIRNSDKKWQVSNVDEHSFVFFEDKEKMLQGSVPWSYGEYEGLYTQKVKVRLELKENNVELKVYDNSTIRSTYAAKKDNLYEGNKDFRTCYVNENKQVENEKIQSSMSINYMILKPRQQ